MALPSAKVTHPSFVQSKALLTAPVLHGFFGRTGGVSTGYFSSLNTGFMVGDDLANVRENNARAILALGLEPALRCGLRQTHSTNVYVASAPWAEGTDAPEGDGMVTNVPGLSLSVLTADCVPVLFAAPQAVGAAHAGWQGAVSGVLENTLLKMEELGAQRHEIRAAIGPCIGGKSYEVSAGFERPFLAEDAGAEVFFKHGAAPDKLFFDLAGYCAYRLARAGVTKVDILGHDTCAMEDTYFSHRRTTKRGEPMRGLQLSAIALK